jgi:hypothetical protein
VDTDAMVPNPEEAKPKTDKAMGRWILFRGETWKEVDSAATVMGRSISEYLEIAHNQMSENEKANRLHLSQMEEMRAIIAHDRNVIHDLRALAQTLLDDIDGEVHPHEFYLKAKNLIDSTQTQGDDNAK